MESQSESHKEPGTTTDTQNVDTLQFVKNSAPAIMQTEPLQNLDAPTTPDQIPAQPTAREIEAGAIQAAAFYEDATGAKFPAGGVDEETAKLLYQLNLQRQQWTDSMENDARATLQLLYPDVGGSKQHGPL